MKLTAYEAGAPTGVLVLAHGAGAGQRSGFMVNTCQALVARDITSATFDFDYISAGRRVPDRPLVLEAAWRRAAAEALERFGGLPLFIGGKSMGGRIATHIAAQGIHGIVGIVLLGYPLHPPGRPHQRRDAHLRDVKEPMLFVQGSLDTFGNESEMSALVSGLPRATLHIIDGGDHSFKVKGGAAAQQRAFAEAVSIVADWIQAQMGK